MTEPIKLDEVRAQRDARVEALADEDVRSFKVEVIADSSGKWVSNAVRLPTAEDARAYGRDLAGRWISVRNMRVMPSTDHLTNLWADGRLIPVKPGDVA
jgi:hypothetical protein